MVELSSVIREVRSVALECGRLYPGIIGMKIDKRGVFICKEDWKYFQVGVSTVNLIDAIRESNLDIQSINCIIDDESEENYSLVDGILHIYELRL